MTTVAATTYATAVTAAVTAVVATGFIVAGRHEGERWLLTNAHSVDYHTQASRLLLVVMLWLPSCREQGTGIDA